MKKINRILIANRGEIAIRIIKTCQLLNIETVAIFSESDNNSPHIKMADYIYYIGKSPASESYLNIDKIIELALKTKVDAIHPGYGFLSENPEFAKRCQENNIIFIGPDYKILELSASKTQAKNYAKSINVPVIPGYEESEQSMDRLITESERIGFPLLIKARYGGGGKGMKIVYNQNELENAVNASKRESLNSFGNDAIFLEKYFDSCKHIEWQIIGDSYGNVIHLGERECSIQRRYQKIIEESPSFIPDDLRTKMAETSLKIAKELNYTNAGTIEYIVDKDNNFYFLEINPRLQVEHPVTEMITGLDIIKMQIEIAEGKELKLSQDDIKFSGHAIECRIYAENPNNNFSPSIGKVLDYKFPDTLRVDNGINLNSDISVYYDPMLAKIVSYGENREHSLGKMVNGLKKSYVFGLDCNIDFLINVLSHREFIEQNYFTSFINKNWSDLKKPKSIDIFIISATLHNWQIRNSNRKILKSIPSGWRNNFYQNQKENFIYNNEQYNLEYKYLQHNKFEFFYNQDKYDVELVEANNDLSSIINGKYFIFEVVTDKNSIYLNNNNHGTIHLINGSLFPQNKKEDNKNDYKSSLPGEIKKINVQEGQHVKEGDSLMIMYSMKMETTIYAGSEGIIENIFVSENSFVDSDVLLLKIKESSEHI